MDRSNEVRVIAVRPSKLLLAILAGLVLALAIDLFGTPGLVVVTLLLVLGIALRAVVAVVAPAIACSAVLVLSVLATMGCDSAIQDCTVETPTLVLFGWLVLVVVIAAIETQRLVAHSRHAT
jgi:hypothetical protein